jgi:dTDP-4-amino-4,6-dideoxygalactose transaminase
VTLTPSCTHALELAALVAGLSPGDEVVMPSWTFVSTANAVALRGATPVWADVRPETLTLDVDSVAAAITPSTKAIVVVHYGGVAADMDALVALAETRGLTLIEDAAHALLATWRGRPLGTLGTLGCLSFHVQKNVSCGEGGALLVAAESRAEAIEQAAANGTNRHALLRGETREYRWLGLGSAWELGGLAAAFLRGQLEAADWLTARRLHIWRLYERALTPVAPELGVRLARVPGEAEPNGHIFWLMLPGRAARDAFIAAMGDRGIDARFHYVPLHRAPAAQRFARAGAGLAVTEAAGDGLVRLPVWAGMDDADAERVAAAALDALGSADRSARTGRAARMS